MQKMRYGRRARIYEGSPGALVHTSQLKVKLLSICLCHDVQLCTMQYSVLAQLFVSSNVHLTLITKSKQSVRRETVRLTLIMTNIIKLNPSMQTTLPCSINIGHTIKQFWVLKILSTILEQMHFNQYSLLLFMCTEMVLFFFVW